jgi:hypothetical protein
VAIATLRNVLVSTSAVTSLVPQQNITPLIRPQAIEPPAVTLQRVSLTPTNHLINAGQLDANTVQLDVWAKSYATARSIADECRTALEAASYHMTFEGDSYEPETDPELYRVTQNWSVWTT